MNREGSKQIQEVMRKKQDDFWLIHEPTGFANVTPKQWDLYAGWLERECEAIKFDTAESIKRYELRETHRRTEGSFLG